MEAQIEPTTTLDLSLQRAMKLCTCPEDHETQKTCRYYDKATRSDRCIHLRPEYGDVCDAV